MPVQPVQNEIYGPFVAPVTSGETRHAGSAPPSNITEDIDDEIDEPLILIGHSDPKVAVFVNPMPASEVEAELPPKSTAVSDQQTCKEIKIDNTHVSAPKPPSSTSPGGGETKVAKQDPKAHMSLMSLDNIHTISVLCWRRSRHAYVAALNAKKKDDGDDDDRQWHFKESALFMLYRAVGFFVLFAQFTFLWSLLDLNASDFKDKDLKRSGFPIKYTSGMVDRDFGSGPLNVSIAAWDAARSASNVRQCQTWVLECGARWDAGKTCERESDISFSCYPWDYEKFLQGRNGTRPMCYRSSGAAVPGGLPYYGSMTRGVIQDWVFRFARARTEEHESYSEHESKH